MGHYGIPDYLYWWVMPVLCVYALCNATIGTIIIWAKLSDIFGRKVAAIATLFIFAAFSGVCGAAQTMNQL